jgi:hypothetical protein
MKSIPKTWERLQDYIQAWSHHRIENWLVLRYFYDGLTIMSMGHIDTATGCSFPSPMMEPRLSSIKWCQIKARGRTKITKGMHTVKETDMLATKIDLMKRLEEQAQHKDAMKGTV